MLFWLIWNWKSLDNQITEEKNGRSWIKEFKSVEIFEKQNVQKRKEKMNIITEEEEAEILIISSKQGVGLFNEAPKKIMLLGAKGVFPWSTTHTHTRGRNVRKLYIWFEKSHLHLCMPMAFFSWNQFHENFSWKWFHGNIVCKLFGNKC